MGWVIFLGVVLLFGVLVWRREHRGSRGGFAIRGERGQASAHQAEMELRTSSSRSLNGFPGGGGPSF